MRPLRSNGAISRVDEALSAIRSAIQQRRLLPGEALRLDALSQELKMSVQPVREAIRLLEAEGLVERSNNRGVVVAKVPLDQIIDLACIRNVLEPMMASLATLRASSEEVVELRATHDQIRRLIEAGAERETILPLTIDWHRQIHRCARSTYLNDFVERVWAAIWINSAWRSSHAEDTIVEHDAIISAIEDRDPEAAAVAMRAHVRESGIGHIEGFSGEGSATIPAAIAKYEALLEHLCVAAVGKSDPGFDAQSVATN